MQGQRGTINSYPDTVDLDQGSVSNSSGMNQQTSWSMFDPVENQLPNSALSSAESYLSPSNSAGRDFRRFSVWDSGEPSSSFNPRNPAIDDGTKTEHGYGWSSQYMAGLGAGPGMGPRLGEGQFERNKMVLPDVVNVSSTGNLPTSRPLFMQTNRPTTIPQNVNLNAGYMGNSGNIEQSRGSGGWSNLCKSGRTETDQIPSASFSGHVGTSSGYCGSALEENDGGSDTSLGSWGLSCKRKTLEGTSAHSHPGGSSGCFTKAENSMWHAVPSDNNISSGFISSMAPWNSRGGTSSEQLNQRVSGGASDAFPTLSVSGHAESSQSNFGRRGNSGHVSSPFNLSGSSNVCSSDLPRPLLYTDSLGPRSAAGVGPSINVPQSQSQLTQIQGPSTNMYPPLWNGGQNPRFGASPSTLSRTLRLREDSNLRSAEHNMFIPASETRNLGQDPTNWSLATGVNTSTVVPSPSQLSTSSSVRPLPTPSWVSHQSPPTHNQHRLAGFSPWALFPSVETETGGPSGHFPQLPSVPSNSSPGIDAMVSSGTISQGHRLPRPRSTFLMDRQGDDALGMRHPLRDLAADIEGRHRLISEIRQVLNAMRRGNNIRIEDSFLFDPFIFSGSPEVHDRHRDMRLDVDNMSYEELLALEERIGDVNTGLSEETILKLMKQQKYATMMPETASDMEPCCICREEYNVGEDLGMLDCGHDFHTDCIRQWLMMKNICPICKTTGLVT